MENTFTFTLKQQTLIELDKEFEQFKMFVSDLPLNYWTTHWETDSYLSNGNKVHVYCLTVTVQKK